jgi:hypothetical protein
MLIFESLRKCNIVDPRADSPAADLGRPIFSDVFLSGRDRNGGVFHQVGVVSHPQKGPTSTYRLPQNATPPNSRETT